MKENKKEIKLGDIVKVWDWSWHLDVSTLKGYTQCERYLDHDNENLWKVVKKGKFPAHNDLVEASILPERCRKQNNVMLLNLVDGRTIFTQEHLLRIPILYRKF